MKGEEGVRVDHFLNWCTTSSLFDCNWNILIITCYLLHVYTLFELKRFYINRLKKQIYHKPITLFPILSHNFVFD